MNLLQYVERHGVKGERELARRAQLNPRYLYHCRSGRRNPSIKVCMRLIAASDFELSMRGLLEHEMAVDNPDAYWNGRSHKRRLSKEAT